MAEVSVWAYPWDLHDIGVAEASDRIAAVGAGMVSLAVSYHAGRFVQPGNPRRRVYYPQDGTVYYRVDPSRWQGAEIAPLQADIVDSEGDMLAEVIRRRDAGGLAVSCWTVCLHNTRLGMRHPGHVIRTAQGDPAYYGLCPSSAAVRAYVVVMVAEIAQVYAPDRIELESPDFMGFAHGFHHEKDGLPLLAEDGFLLGVCFCRHCLRAATAAGIPAEDARLWVAGHLERAFARELPVVQFPEFVRLGMAAFAALPEVFAYLMWRSTPVTALVAEIRSAVPLATRLLLIDAEGTWASGVDRPALVPHLDGILHCAYRTAPADIAALMAQRRALLGPDKTLIAGLQLYAPNIRDRADLATRLGSIAGLVDGVNFYGLGLVPPARLDWIRTALGDAGDPGKRHDFSAKNLSSARRLSYGSRTGELP